MVNSGARLPLDQFEAIARKAAAEGYKRIGLFNWTEPFLNPDLAKYMEMIKKLGFSSMLSSNFSLRRIPHLEPVLRVTDHIIVSVSGFDQAVYEINHVGGDINYVVTNLRRTAELRSTGRISTVVVLRLLRFAYNHEEEPKLRRLASELGIEFEVLEGVGNPLQPLSGITNGTFTARQEDAKINPDTAPPDKVCPLVFGQIPVNSRGDAYLCCAYPNYAAMRIGRYLEMSQEELLLARHHHPICASCNLPRRQATPEDKQAFSGALSPAQTMYAVIRRCAKPFKRLIAMSRDIETTSCSET